MSLLPDHSGGYYDSNGKWVRLKYCFVYCGPRCNCQPPNGLHYNPMKDERSMKQRGYLGGGTEYGPGDDADREL